MRYIYVLLILAAFAGCRKETNSFIAISSVQNQLRDSVDIETLSSLDFKKFIFSRENQQQFVRIGFTGKKIESNFVLLKLGGDGTIMEGRMINIKIDPGISANGKINIQYLNRISILSDANIINGNIQWHTGAFQLREMIVPGADGKVLPEVIVVGIVKKPNISLMNYYSLYGLMGGGSSGNSSYYSSSGSSPSGGSSGTTNNDGVSKNTPAGGKSNSKAESTTGASGVKDDVILVDFETSQANPAINIPAYIKCFDNIPDAGATCSIELFADIPVDNDPNKLFDWKTRSPGHCFLQIKKTTASQSVIQNIGFYPETDFKSILTPAPVKGKFVDNSSHEFNASIKMTLSAENLHAVLNQMLYLAKFVQYDIDEYNCTDFALEIFNYRRPTPLEIVKIDLPGGQAPLGSNTPQGVYLKLQEMKKAGTVESASITSGIVKGYVANGKGPCN